MHNHANHIAAMPGVLLIDGDKPGFFTEHELLSKPSESKSLREVRHKIVTIRTVDRIMDGLVMQGK